MGGDYQQGQGSVWDVENVLNYTQVVGAQYCECT